MWDPSEPGEAKNVGGLTLKRHFAGITYYIIYDYIQDLEVGKPSPILGMCSVCSNIYCVQYIVIK